MAAYRFTPYFENEVLRKRPYLSKEMCVRVAEQPSAESREISEGVVLDYDESGKLVGIDIDNASDKVELHRFVVSKIPAPVK